MGDKTGIEWTDATWTIVQGCDIESPGCSHCYVPPLLWRLAHNPNPTIAAPLQGLVEMTKGGPQFTGKLALREDRLDWPLKWREPRRIFVPSHGDLFHPDVPDRFIDRVFAVIAATPHHTYQIPTKRPARMRAYIEDGDLAVFDRWPLPNIWLGASVEDQRRADERQESMRALAAQGWLTWVSYEPALTTVDWTGWEFIRWLVSGGESGKKARPSHPDWHRAARDWCAANRIAYFFKQWGEWTEHDGEPVARGKSLVIRPNGAVSEVWNDSDPPGTTWLVRAGKAAAGRLLDGREWNEFPA